MTDLNYSAILKKHHWLVFQEQDNPRMDQKDVALAYQDSFLRYLLAKNDSSDPSTPYGIIHFYPIFKPSVFLGAKDLLLPLFGQGAQLLQEAGYLTSLRPHGGLAVVEDPGILNVAFVTDSRSVKLSIDEAFGFALYLIQLSLEDFGLQLEAYEITDSYCPGKYDVVINGLKVGGIAQRRYRDAVTTAAYIGVDGDQQARGQLIQSFYQAAEADHRFPQVNPASMATLSQLIKQPLTLSDYQAHFIDRIARETSLQTGHYQAPHLEEIFQPLLIKAQQRSQKIDQRLL